MEDLKEKIRYTCTEISFSFPHLQFRANKNGHNLLICINNYALYKMLPLLVVSLPRPTYHYL